MKNFLTTTLKLFSAPILIPVGGIMAEKVWPWWEEATGKKKIFAAFIILPMAIILQLTLPRWKDL